MRVKLGGEGCLDFRIRSHTSPTLPPHRGLLEIVHLGQTLQPNLRLFWLSRVNHELGRKPCSRSNNSHHRKLQRRGVHWSSITCSSHNFSSIPGDEDGMSSAGQEPSRVCSDVASASSKALSKTTVSIRLAIPPSNQLSNLSRTVICWCCPEHPSYDLDTVGPST